MAVAIPKPTAVHRRVRVCKSEPAIDCLFVGIEESTYVCDNELEIRANDAYAEGWERECPVRIAVSLHRSEDEGDKVCTSTDTNKQFVRNFVLDQGSDQICRQAAHYHR
jgi:hypothetical protein